MRFQHTRGIVVTLRKGGINVVTRREMSSKLIVMLGAFLSQISGALLRAEGSPVERNPQDPKPNSPPIAVETLMREPLAETPDAEARMVTLTVAPGASSSAHKHTGPVFAYLLEGEIENQVAPGPPRRYKAGEFFYEPPLHVHRSLRNLSGTKAAKLLIFEVGEKGKQFTIGAN